ncbi:MAG: hypothetical protein PG981_001403 [Wolbachia endosymbiont of Ctenocephalides orientis wCori]|nr:MAG: hypothetical protein PG981_001403 [Wolbachia endosymbiont of Ctenocephalides orientis wCori]
MKSYVGRELKSSKFLRDNTGIFVLLEKARLGSAEEKIRAMNALVGLFTLHPELNYGTDILILSLILENIEVFLGKVEPELNNLIGLLEERVKKLEYLEDKMDMLAEGDKVSIASEIEGVEKELSNTREKIKEQLALLNEVVAA